MAHFREWAELAEHVGNAGARARYLDAIDYSIHVHTWTSDTFKTFLKHCRDTWPRLPFDLVELVPNDFEFVVILRKT